MSKITILFLFYFSSFGFSKDHIFRNILEKEPSIKNLKLIDNMDVTDQGDHWSCVGHAGFVVLENSLRNQGILLDNENLSLHYLYFKLLIERIIFIYLKKIKNNGVSYYKFKDLEESHRSLKKIKPEAAGDSLIERNDMYKDKDFKLKKYHSKKWGLSNRDSFNEQAYTEILQKVSEEFSYLKKRDRLFSKEEIERTLEGVANFFFTIDNKKKLNVIKKEKVLIPQFKKGYFDFKYTLGYAGILFKHALKKSINSNKAVTMRIGRHYTILSPYYRFNFGWSQILSTFEAKYINDKIIIDYFDNHIMVINGYFEQDGELYFVVQDSYGEKPKDGGSPIYLLPERNLKYLDASMIYSYEVLSQAETNN